MNLVKHRSFYSLGRRRVTVAWLYFLNKNLKLDSIKVDREDHLWHPGFIHIIVCVFLGYKDLNFVKNLDVTDV